MNEIENKKRNRKIKGTRGASLKRPIKLTNFCYIDKEKKNKLLKSEIKEGTSLLNLNSNDFKRIL